MGKISKNFVAFSEYMNFNIFVLITLSTDQFFDRFMDGSKKWIRKMLIQNFFHPIVFPSLTGPASVATKI
jgi:hypothetical protein